MSKESIASLIPDFLKTYDSGAKDLVWQQHRDAFRQFWSEHVLAPGHDALSDATCDAIIRILDTHGKGNTRDSEAVANVMVPQGAWRRMFNAFRSDKELALLVDSVLKTQDPK